MDKHTVKSAFKSSLPVLAGYLVLGFGFGVLLAKGGYSPIWALGMSVTIYAGAMQYVGTDLLVSGAGLVSVALTTLMVQARHLFYGISLVERYKGAGWKKFFMIYEITDETYALVSAEKYPDGVHPHWYCFFVSLFDHIYWIIGGLLGCFVGSTVNFNAAGIEFSMTAIFVSVFVEQWKSSKNHTPAIIGVVATAACLLIFGSESFLIPAMIAITVLLFAFRKQFEKREAGDDNGR